MKANKAMKVAAELSQFIASASTPYHSASVNHPASTTSSTNANNSNDQLNQQGLQSSSNGSSSTSSSYEIPPFSVGVNGSSSNNTNDSSSGSGNRDSINASSASASSFSNTESLSLNEKLEGMKHDPSFPSSILGINRSSLNYKISDRGVPFPFSREDQQRIEILNSLHVVDTDSNDLSFDNVTRLATLLLGFPIALVSLVTNEKQWFKSRQGVGVGETPRDVALCNYVVLEDSADVVQMLPFRDPILSQSPLVQSLPIGFYAGAPLVINGHKVGTLCVIDQKERMYLDPKEQEILKSLANVIVELLLLHQKRAQEAIRASNFAKERSILLQTLGSMTTGAFIVDRTTSDYRIIYVNSGACKIYGCNEDQLLNKPLESVVRGEKTNGNDFEKLRSTIQFARSGTIMMQSDRMNKYALANMAAGSSITFWAKYVVTQLGPEDNLFASMSASHGAKKSGTGATDDSLQLGAYCFVEVSNEDRLAQASLEVEKTKEEATVAIDSRRVLMINLAREIRSKLDLIVQAGSLILSSSVDAASTGNNNGGVNATQKSEQSVNEFTQLARVIVENGLYLTSLANTMAAHEMASADGNKRSSDDNSQMDAEKRRRMQ